MSREWKVGDRFSVEGVITEAADSAGDYRAIFDGHTTDGSVLGAEMACAKLICPAAPEPQKLDLTKPVRRIWSGYTGRIVGKTLDGKKIVFERDLGGMCIGPESDFENIPEPKRTYEQIVELVPFFDGIRIVEPGDPFKFVGIKSRAKISYVEGEGWSIEEEA